MTLPPGPRLPGALALAIWMARPTHTLDENFRRYGDIYSVNNPLLGREVIVSHPELMRAVLAGDPKVFLGGEPAKSIAVVVGGGSVLLLDGERHHEKRKMLLPPFHGERLVAYADTMRQVASARAKTFPSDDAFKLLPHMQRITLDAILQTVLGARDGEEIEALRATLVAFLDEVQSPLGMVWMIPAFQRDLGPLTGWASMKRKIEAADALVRARIAKARATPEAERGDDILAMLVSARDERGEGMSDDDIRDQLVTLLIAGHETTATALAWCFEEILRRPEIHMRIREEIGAADDVHRKQLPYLDATIKEVLRLRPLTSLLPRTLAEEVTLRSFALPKGTNVVANIYSAQRHPDYWERPDELSPERFLGTKPDPYAWLPFGAGSRRCIGMAFALLEMRIVLATILAEVELEAVAKPSKVGLRSFLLAPANGARVRVRRRAPD